ncbi:MAG TPA: MBG domain-containing protein [Solirubrobacteraceae bacterium]|jgi:hypothetical protein|nr:MBG domain-containing protein [Solirubrobacteraceae bacterium]
MAGLRRLLVGLVAVVALGVVAGQADAFVYWANAVSTTIGRASPDGTGVNQSFVGGASTPAGVAVDGHYLYWTDDTAGTIGRANLDGSGVNQRFITGADDPIAMAVAGSYIYWTNENLGTIGRANLDGSGVNQSFITTGGVNLAGVAVDDAHVYWSEEFSARIGRANLDGTGVDETFITGPNYPVGVAVNANYIYWANFGMDGSGSTIGRANLDGSGVDESFIAGVSGPAGVAVNADGIYWANFGAETGSTIGTANLDGSGVNESLITGATAPLGVAVDAIASAAPLTVNAPSASASYGAVPATFTPTYTGFLPGDSPASLTPAATCTSNATDTSPPGTYQITCSGAMDPNYTIGYGPAGTLTITQAATKLVAAPASFGLLSVTFSAKLSRGDNGAPISGKTIAFSGQGNTCQTTTNASGVATCTVFPALLITLGPTRYTASFPGDTVYQAMSANGQLTSGLTVLGLVLATRSTGAGHGAIVHATLRRGGVLYASGSGRMQHGVIWIKPTLRHRLQAGRYTLTLVLADGHGATKRTITLR